MTNEEIIENETIVRSMLNGASLVAFNKLIETLKRPVPMLLWCPECSSRHVDIEEYATKPHHTHACQACGHVWRPAIGPTVGVRFLPGFKNEPKDHNASPFSGNW